MKNATVLWRCRTCGVQRWLSESAAMHGSRCEMCRPAPKPMRWVTYDCATCHVTATRRVPGDGPDPRFCSNPCRLAWFSTHFRGENSPHYEHGHGVPYGEFWKPIRRAVVARDGGICRVCGETKRLAAAHLIPRRAFVSDQRPWLSDHHANLITLCMAHHMSFDRNVRTRYDYVSGERAEWPAWTAQPVAWKVEYAKMIRYCLPAGDEVVEPTSWEVLLPPKGVTVHPGVFAEMRG